MRLLPGQWKWTVARNCFSWLRQGFVLRGSPKYVFSETLNAVCGRFKHFKPFLAAGWSVLTRWEEEEPVERSMVMPEARFKAAVAVALLWRWPFFVAAALLGFHALLRLGEILALRRQDLILPRDLLPTTPLAYVRILGSKTRRFLQRQHAKVSDACTVHYLSARFGEVTSRKPLLCSTVLRTSFDAAGTLFSEDWACQPPKVQKASRLSLCEARVPHGFIR